MKVFLRLAALAVLSALAVHAVDWQTLQPQGYVSDFSQVVDPRDREALEKYCKAVENSTGAQIALVTLPSLQGEPVEDVANTIFRAWGVGKKKTNEGILLLLVTGDRRSRLEVGYGLEPYLPDGFAGSLLRDMRPALRQGSYGGALIAAAREIGNRIASAKNVTIESPPPTSVAPAPDESVSWGLMAAGAMFVFWLWTLTRGTRQRRRGGGFLPGLLAGSMFSGGDRGGSSSGGFGGFDSSDSFGGFGGGDSGGGGASSDW
jgi:uncharacterized protein